MSKPLSENARVVLDYLKENAGKDVTYTQIADDTGLAPRTVNGIITSALVKRGLAARIHVEGQEKKLVILTETGLVYDPTVEDVAEEA